MDRTPLSPPAAAVARRLATVRERLATAGADPERVRIVAVTKGRGDGEAEAALEAGLGDLAENYAQELAGRAAAMPGARWHFIGNLQANKVRRLAPHVTLWQSVDRPRLVSEIARRAPGAAILVQVAPRPAPGRGGCEPAQARRLVGQAAELGLRVEGLMVMALPGSSEEVSAQFRAVRSLADELELAECSMGTTADYLLAAAEGATMVRLGRILFEDPPEPDNDEGEWQNFLGSDPGRSTDLGRTTDHGRSTL